MNETTKIEFPSKKPVKELNAYNNFLAEGKIENFLNSSNQSR